VTGFNGHFTGKPRLLKQAGKMFILLVNSAFYPSGVGKSSISLSGCG